MKIIIKFVTGRTETIYNVKGWTFGDYGTTFWNDDNKTVAYIPYRNYEIFIIVRENDV